MNKWSLKEEEKTTPVSASLCFGIIMMEELMRKKKKEVIQADVSDILNALEQVKVTEGIKLSPLQNDMEDAQKKMIQSK